MLLTRWTAGVLLAAALFAAACGSESRRQAPDRQPGLDRPAYLKGQTHVHTNNSGDSHTPAADVARWYARRGFDFVVFTDHNAVTVQPSSEILTIPGVEITQNLRTCLPPPSAGGACLLHINALFADPSAKGALHLPEPSSMARVDIYQAALDVTRSLGGIAQLNHPNMGWAVDVDLAIELGRRGVALLEIANMNEAESNAGDGAHPSAEALWDRVLTSGALAYGVATDDAHHYDDADATRRRGEPAFVGNLGYIMVRAERNVGSIRSALQLGQFYSTTGIELVREEIADGHLTIQVLDDGHGPHEITFIGTGGQELRSVRGAAASFDLRSAPAGYVRTRVVDKRGRMAWTQPVRTPL